ncbi:MAG: hypothetical protein KIT74_12085 [Fimbriimonadales bacterium]|nr:hypothetical protein [Fimbriimonadales bacterium]
MELVRRTLENFGGPMAADELAIEIATAKRVESVRLAERLPQMLAADRNTFVTESGLCGLNAWLFMATDEPEEVALYMNGLSEADAQQAKAAFGNIDFSDLQKAAKSALASVPFCFKWLGYCAWKQLNSSDPYAPRLYDPVALFDAVVNQPGFVFAANGYIYAETEAQKWLKEALKEAEKAVPVIETEEAAPLEFSAEDVDLMVERILRSDTTFSVSRMLEEKYEITPADRTYAEDLANAMNALHSDGRLWFVGGDRFRRPDSAPEFIYTVPEFFNFPVSEFTDDDGEPIDVELTDDGFSSAVRKEMGNPLAMDVLDEELLPKPKKLPEQTKLVLKSLHREIGTFPLCQFPTGWLSEEPQIQEVLFVDPQGRELSVWVNHEARLMFNLIDWWFEQPVESGAVFTLTKTQRPNVFEFSWLDETDPLLFISSERMEELRDLAARSSELSNYEILMEVLGHYSKGADYLTILAEANVVRRMSRRMVASILTGYHCFFQRSGSPVWHFDAKKVDQGFDKAKRKFVKK